ncbi:hypothetical protein [Pseudonocardia sp.]|uniref:hypothetical protein n=1 Tax=Pseudonocardia sp. TaxID=60912 RepID=UPI002601F50E|nr:hypothetical protein [Pseudonocardia sp.]
MDPNSDLETRYEADQLVAPGADPETDPGAEPETDPWIDPDAPVDTTDGDRDTEMPYEADPADVAEQRSSVDPPTGS